VNGADPRTPPPDLDPTANPKALAGENTLAEPTERVTADLDGRPGHDQLRMTGIEQPDRGAPRDRRRRLVRAIDRQHDESILVDGGRFEREHVFEAEAFTHSAHADDHYRGV
jgi:hypothetical protein